MFQSFQRLLNSEAGKYIISILLGIGLATLFRKACNGRNCLVFKAPSPDDIKDKIYEFDNACLKQDHLSTLPYSFAIKSKRKSQSLKNRPPIVTLVGSYNTASRTKHFAIFRYYIIYL